MPAERLSAKEIIDETVAFYTEDLSRRAVANTKRPLMPGEEPSCYYVVGSGTPEQRCCAVGRCLRPELLSYLEDELMPVDCLRETLLEQEAPEVLGELDFPSDSIDDLLQPQYRGQSTKFWKILQRFHDRDSHWNLLADKVATDPLTPDGHAYVEYLIAGQTS